MAILVAACPMRVLRSEVRPWKVIHIPLGPSLGLHKKDSIIRKKCFLGQRPFRPRWVKINFWQQISALSEYDPFKLHPTQWFFNFSFWHVSWGAWNIKFSIFTLRSNHVKKSCKNSNSGQSCWGHFFIRPKIRNKTGFHIFFYICSPIEKYL